MTTQQNIAGDGAITDSRFPIRLLATALVLTAITFAWFGKIILENAVKRSVSSRVVAD